MSREHGGVSCPGNDLVPWEQSEAVLRELANAAGGANIESFIVRLAALLHDTGLLILRSFCTGHLETSMTLWGNQSLCKVVLQVTQQVSCALIIARTYLSITPFRSLLWSPARKARAVAQLHPFCSKRACAPKAALSAHV